MSVALRAFQLYFPTNYMVHNFEISTFTILLLLYHHPKTLMQKYIFSAYDRNDCDTRMLYIVVHRKIVMP